MRDSNSMIQLVKENKGFDLYLAYIRSQAISEGFRNRTYQVSRQFLLTDVLVYMLLNNYNGNYKTRNHH